MSNGHTTPGTGPDIFELADAGLAIMSDGGVLVRTNPAFQRIAGRRAEELAGQPLAPLFPEAAPTFGSCCQTAMLRGDGVLLPVKLSLSTPLASGETVVTVVTTDDRLDPCRTCHYPVMVNAIDEGLTVHAWDGRIAEINRAGEEMLGQSCAGTDVCAPGTRCFHLDGTPFKKDEHPALKALNDGEKAGDLVMGYAQPGEPVRWLRVASNPIHHPWLGKAVMSSFVDVTELITVQHKLEESESRLRAIYENTFEFIGLLDLSGRMVDVNRAALSLIDATMEQVRGVPFPDTPWWAHSEKDRQRLRQAIERGTRGEFDRFETSHVGKDGKTVYVDFSLCPVFDDAGKVVFLLPEGRDITDRKTAEAALVAAKVEAESASRAKSQFLATVSHELRTPLNAVIGFSEAILTEMFGPLGNDRYLEYLRLINSAGQSLRNTIEDILDVSRIELGATALDEVPMDMGETLNGIAHLLRHKAQAGGIELSVLPATGLPDVVADPRRVRQILLNLLSNALKFTPKGGSARLAAQHTERGLEIEVADTGIGIQPEHLSRIWQPFYQVDGSLSRRHEGVGLGLALVRHYVDAHGGTVEVESQPGAGTTFRVIMPPSRLRPHNDNGAPLGGVGLG